jgi:hypothetical protein
MSLLLSSISASMRLDFPDSLSTLLVYFMRLSQREDYMTQAFEIFVCEGSNLPVCRGCQQISEPKTAISNRYQPYHEMLAEHYPTPSKETANQSMCWRKATHPRI